MEQNINVEFSKDPVVLDAFSRDISNFKIVPEVVFYPKNTQEVQEVVRLAQAEQKPVSVRAGGTCMSGGSLNSGYILDLTKYMNEVTVDAQTKTATVQAGAYFRDIEDKAKEHDLFFAGYPSSNRICGIGGMLGNNASGEKSLRHGATGVNVIDLEVVLADGTVASMHSIPVSELHTEREKALFNLHTQYGASLKEAIGNVKKCASGYRLDELVKDGMFSEVPLMVGSQGTLGIITSATLRLVELPNYTSLLIVSAQDLHQLSDIVATALQCHPEGLETFDKNTFSRARSYLSAYADKVVPYVDLNAHLYILIQLSEETEVATEEMSTRCASLLAEKGYFVQSITNPVDIEATWMVRRNSFTLMKDHNPEHFKAVPCIEDVIVPLTELGTFIDGLISILHSRNITYGFHGHIGDGSFRVVPIFDFRSATLTDEIFGLMEEVFALVKKLKGNMSADHSDGIIRTPFLEEFYGTELNGVFAKIKNLYDPNSILNPGKKVGGTRQAIIETMQK